MYTVKSVVQKLRKGRGGEMSKSTRERRERKGEKGREREREGAQKGESTISLWTDYTCIIFKSIIAKLLTVLMVAVAMERVEFVRGGGDEECLGGPSCKRIA